MTERHRPCPFCGTNLPATSAESLDSAGRLAYDPWKGRLWAVCSGCRRWSQVPMSMRWETLEACEEAVQRSGRILMSSGQLTLIGVGRRELVRVGRPPRIEMAGWRYGERLPRQRTRGFFRSLFDGLPPPPVHGYRPYALGRADPPTHWVLSPFQDSAWALTTVFTAIPLASVCPSCGGPLALKPWSFHVLKLVARTDPAVVAPCGLCGDEVHVGLRAVRPALRLGLAVVDGTIFAAGRAEDAAGELERAGGALGVVRRLGVEGVTVGDMAAVERATLAMALDEDAELEALEREWREEEEIAEIMDGELTTVPGFERFKENVLRSDQGGGF